MRRFFLTGETNHGFFGFRRKGHGMAWFFPLKWLHPPEFLPI